MVQSFFCFVSVFFFFSYRLIYSMVQTKACSRCVDDVTNKKQNFLNVFHGVLASVFYGIACFNSTCILLRVVAQIVYFVAQFFQLYKADVLEPVRTRRLTVDIGNLDDVTEADELETMSSLSSHSMQLVSSCL